MACCCTNILRLCKVGTCEDDVIDLGIAAAVAGIHKLTFEFLEGMFTIEKDFLLGDALKFPTKGLNENYTYQATLSGPSGKITITQGEEEFDCIEFQTAIFNTL